MRDLLRFAGLDSAHGFCCCCCLSCCCLADSCAREVNKILIGTISRKGRTLRAVHVLKREVGTLVTCHFSGIESGIQLVFGEAKFFKALGAQFSDRSSGFHGLFGNIAGLVVANHRRQ